MAKYYYAGTDNYCASIIIYGGDFICGIPTLEYLCTRSRYYGNKKNNVFIFNYKCCQEIRNDCIRDTGRVIGKPLCRYFGMSCVFPTYACSGCRSYPIQLCDYVGKHIILLLFDKDVASIIIKIIVELNN